MGNVEITLPARVSKLEERTSLHDLEIKRLQSDYESEKGTRARSHTDLSNKLDTLKDAFNERMGAMEKRIYMAMGGLGVIAFVLKVVFGH